MTFTIWFVGFIMFAFIGMFTISILEKRNFFSSNEIINKYDASMLKTLSFFIAFTWPIGVPLVALASALFAIFFVVYAITNKLSDMILPKSDK